ncbi:MAG: hypothetical protein HY840_16140 [Bacteroidetes bacterium]|nr:hypothetical protein [Bacteroidota bacterium]
MKSEKKPRAEWKQLSPEEIKNIKDDYYSGVQSSKVIHQYKISRDQLVNMIRNFIKDDYSEKEKLIVKPKHIPLYK